MLKFEEICELVRLVGSTGVGRVEVEHGGARIEIEGRPQQSVVIASPGDHQLVAAQGHGTPPVGMAEIPPVQVDGVIEEDGHIVPSPIVGTFYRAPNPEADPFVRVGDEVRVGQVLCIVEAMKLMNEIESDIDGQVVKVHIDNAEPVEYGQPLFTLRPA